jgi:YVTN family beta-propeller protein
VQRLIPPTPLILGLLAFATHAAPFAYVPNEKSGTASVIDTSNDQVVGRKLYVANGRSNSVSVIDTESNAVLKEVPVGELPWGVVVQ